MTIQHIPKAGHCILLLNGLPPDPTSGANVLALARDWPRGRKYEGEL